jgi:hypothetical protein
MKDSKIPLKEILLLIAGWVALVILQLIFRRPPFYDEDEYLSNVALLHQYGLGKNYLVHLIGSAGPLFSVVHFIFEPLTGLSAPYVRFVNTGFLVGITYLTYLTIGLLNFQNRFYALFIMAIPMTYVVGGLALTEMPAIFFFSAAVYLAIKSIGLPAGVKQGILLVVAGGCMGLAILGRQPFLLTLAAFPVLFIQRAPGKKNITGLMLFLLSSLVLPGYVFSVWHGLVPTIESQLYIDIAKAGTSYRPDFFLLCTFYFAISIWLISPEFLKPPGGRQHIFKWIICGAIIAAINFTTNWIELLPVKPFLIKILTPGQAHILSVLCGSAVVVLSLYFLLCMYNNLQQRQYPKELLFFTAACLLVAAACVKITWGFSSRYAAQAVPLLVLMGSYTYRNSKYNMVGLLLGVIIGFICIFSYLTGS